MTRLYYFRALIVLTALVVVSAAAFVPMAQGAPASGGTVPQSGNCPAGRQQDEHCLPGAPGSPPARPPGRPPARPGGPIHLPFTPPVTIPIVPPSGGPQATRPQDPELPLFIYGWASATLHIHDDDHDVTYTSGHVELLFQRRAEQKMTGNTQYVLAGDRGRDHMTWNVTGRVFDCTVEGKAFIQFPIELVNIDTISFPGVYTQLDPSRPAFGYLNVVGPDGGDFHSVIIQMFDPDARLTKTCPGNPPLVTKEKFDAGFLLHILWQKNEHASDGQVRFVGSLEYDQGAPLDFLNLIPPGKARDFALESFISGGGEPSYGTSIHYTWEWELFPGFSPAE